MAEFRDASSLGIQIGDLAFVADDEAAFGAVREVAPELVIYVENAGDFVVPPAAVDAVHARKVILSPDKLDPDLRRAIGQAHDAEEPDA